MSRGFRICMAKGVRGCLRPSYGRLKLTRVSSFVATKLRCQGSKTLHQFSSDHLETNRTWAPIGWPQALFVSRLSNQNWRTEFDPWHLLIFRNTTDFFPMTSLWAAVTSKAIILSESWVRKDSVGTGPKKFPIENFWVWSVSPQKPHFRQFSKEILRPRVRSILMPPI